MKIAWAPDGAELAWAEEGQGEPLLLIAGQATAMDGHGRLGTDGQGPGTAFPRHPL